ncbi:hypothetical protein CKO28_04575 [Rhodovibrio sodomensis]|uniref:EAL domain-containing protein n=1 Tax=Rhodovibrio sodomensis TaxID=1088 RepID=A0ABS1DCJ6_9PROT|nr:GGDEF domain-containing phosphodiesterase [Rhodovibrio sodomensis]MBK1667308.1 hypothetical protein [Rhodovibrio sodomensis]
MSMDAVVAKLSPGRFRWRDRALVAMSLALVGAAYLLSQAVLGMQAFLQVVYIGLALSGLVAGTRGSVLIALVGSLLLGVFLLGDGGGLGQGESVQWAMYASLLGVLGWIAGTGMQGAHRLLAYWQQESTRDRATGLLDSRAACQAIDARLAAGDTFNLLCFEVIDHDLLDARLGARGADHLMAAVSARASSALPEGARLYRLRAARIVALIDSHALAELSLDGVITELREPVEINGLQMTPRVSCGVVEAPRHGQSGATLTRVALAAVQQACESESLWSLYDPDWDARKAEDFALLADLRAALGAGGVGLSVNYQPRVRLDGAGCTGVEALLRWTHAARGPISPGRFIPLAEAHGLMREITAFVLRRSLEEGLRVVRCGTVSVNLSAGELLDTDLPDRVAGILAELGVEGSALEIEVTETAVMGHPEIAIRTLEQLRQLGVRLAIDDFGTGHSSLAYLQRLPVDVVKLDRSFIMRQGPREQAITRAAIALSHELGLEIVAEGVEDAETAARLRDWGCDEAQGFHFARPMPAVMLAGWLGQSTVTRVAPGVAGTAAAQ